MYVTRYFHRHIEHKAQGSMQKAVQEIDVRNTEQ